jgi:hypothetical protein
MVYGHLSTGIHQGGQIVGLHEKAQFQNSEKLLCRKGALELAPKIF